MAAAFVAFIATILAAFFGGLIAEDYRRFRTSQGIAAALSGELSGYIEGGKIILGQFTVMKDILAKGGTLPFQEFEMPKDVLYEGLAKDIGLLGTGIAKDVAYVYQRLNGFRVGYRLITRTYKEWRSVQIIEMIDGCAESLRAVQCRAEPLLVKLDAWADKPYEWPRLPKFTRSSKED